MAKCVEIVTKCWPNMNPQAWDGVKSVAESTTLAMEIQWDYVCAKIVSKL
jgi:hypothetical protein